MQLACIGETNTTFPDTFVARLLNARAKSSLRPHWTTTLAHIHRHPLFYRFLRKHAGSHLDRVHQLRDVADVSQYVVDVPFGAPEETMAQQMKQSTLESSSSAYASGDLSPDISRSDSPPYLGAPSEGPGRRYSPSPSSSFIASPTRSSISPLNDIRGPSVLSSPILLKPQTANVSLQRTSSDPKLSYINSTRLPAHLHDSRMTNERENNSASNRLPSFNTLFPDISRVQLTDDRTEFSDIPSPFVQTVSSPIRLCPPREPYTDAQQRLERPPASPSMASERFERPHSSRRDTEIDTRYHQQWTEGSSRDIMIRAQTPPTSRSRRMSISDILNPAEHRQSFVHALSRPRPGHSYNVPSTHPKNDGGRHVSIFPPRNADLF